MPEEVKSAEQGRAILKSSIEAHQKKNNLFNVHLQVKGTSVLYRQNQNYNALTDEKGELLYGKQKIN